MLFQESVLEGLRERILQIVAPFWPPFGEAFSLIFVIFCYSFLGPEK